MQVWVVAATKPSCEYKAIADLADAGFDMCDGVYCPVGPPRATRGKIGPVPLFPGYVFVKMTEQWRDVFGSRHVIGILGSGETPSTLTQDVIDELCGREGPDGVIRFDLPRSRRYGPGAKVRIRKGVLVGLTGAIAKFVGNDKLKILLDMLGRQTMVSIRETEITAA